MKFSISFFLVVICTVVLAAQHSQAKKGCNAYGHACYGGHGKRSLAMGTPNSAGSLEQNDIPQPNNVYQILPNGAPILLDDESNDLPKYRIIKIMKSWFNEHPRHQAGNRNEVDYPISEEALHRDNVVF